MSERSREARARQATVELEITEEAHEKLRHHLLEQAVLMAGSSKTDQALHLLLRVHALDTVRSMMRVPVDDWQIEQSVEEATRSTRAPAN
jgi:hypothetical protein